MIELVLSARHKAGTRSRSVRFLNLELKIFLNILLGPVPFLGFFAPCVGQSSFWSQRTYFYNRIFGALQTYFLDPAGPIPTIVLPLYSPTRIGQGNLFIYSFHSLIYLRIILGENCDSTATFFYLTPPFIHLCSFTKQKLNRN